MWAIRVLNGPQAGQIYKLKKGKNKFGRGSTTDFQFQSTGISKEHFEIEALSDRLVILDLQSSNGTFLNGVRINRPSIAKVGDKLSVHEILFDIIFAQDKVGTQPTLRPAGAPVSPYAMPGQHSFPQPGPVESPVNSPGLTGSPVERYLEKAKHYIEHVALPAVYRLPVVFEFRNVIYGFATVFVLLVTLLSILPMKFITSESITSESKRRALTIDRSLASANSRMVKDGRFAEYDSEPIIKEEGIDQVYILAKDGNILAPPALTGTTPQKELAFVKKLRAQAKEYSAELSDGRVAAGAPIVAYDPQIGENMTRAYAVVIFDSSSLAFNDGRAVSLFVQMLMLASLCGFLIFFFMYKVIERPFSLLKKELDLALREGRDQASIDIRLPVMQEILVSVNSLISRSLHGDSAKPMGSSMIKDQELSNVLSMVGYPALLISRDSIVLGVNQAFERLTSVGAARIQGQSINYIPDQALQKNIGDLLDRAKRNPSQIAEDQLEINSNQALLRCQSVSGSAGEPEYFMVIFSPADEVQGGAA